MIIQWIRFSTFKSMAFKSMAFLWLLLHMLIFVLGSSRVQPTDGTTSSLTTTSTSISSTTSTAGKTPQDAKPTTISSGTTVSAVSSTVDGKTYLHTTSTSKSNSAGSNIAVSQKISTTPYTEKINSSPSLELPRSVSTVVMFLAMILLVTFIFI